MGTVRFDKEGMSWIKIEEDKWESIEEKDAEKGVETETKERTDDEVDNNDEMKALPAMEWEHRKGIFETERMLSSELIPYLTQSIRAFRCRSEAMCKIAQLSVTQSEDDPQERTVQPSGCIELKMQTLPACHFARKDGTYPDAADTFKDCDNVVKEMVQRELDLLKLAMEYDAAYRSMLQFAGNFDLFVKELRWPLTFTIRQVAGIVGQFNRIPCFLSSCDASEK